MVSGSRTKLEEELKRKEDEAKQKAKDAQHAAGKNVGMSGRDLVRFFLDLMVLPSLMASSI